VVTFGLLYVPTAVLAPFASDFARDEQGQVCIRPNRAARVGHVLEDIRMHACVIGLLSILSFPVGILVGLQGRLLAVVVLVTGILVYGVMESIFRFVAACRKRRSK
jgi:hypothetical protein